MLSYRQQILLGYLAVLLMFMIILLPLSNRFATMLTVNAMESRADEVIAQILPAQDEPTMIRRLKDKTPMLFFRVSLINDELITLHDTHALRTRRMASRPPPIPHPEVVDALENGVGQATGYSDMLGQEFLYLAKRFQLNDRNYVLRMAVPSTYVTSLTNDIEFTFIIAGSVLMLAFSLLSWFIVSWLSRPVQQIVDSIRPYQQGLQSDLPNIQLRGVRPDDDFYRLATTLNQLAERSRQHIATLQGERDEKESLLESLVEGVFAVDSRLQIQDCNGAGLKMVDKSRDEVMRKPLAVLKIAELTTLARQCIDERKIATTTIELRGNVTIYLDVVVAPSLTKQGAVIILADTSIQHRLLQMRKEFIANASHELKTPITIILGFAETLRDNPGLPQTVSYEITEKIIRNCTRMNNLVKDLLALADIERLAESAIEEVSMARLVEESKRHLMTGFPSAQVNLDIKGSRKALRVDGDPSLLEMAVTNLLSNAARYSEPPAQITVTLSETKEHVVISVADKGFGIPEEDLPRIFERFYTVDKARSRKMGGTGLGLAIVETIVNKHFGSINVESKVGVGTTFTLRLPKRRSKR